MASYVDFINSMLESAQAEAERRGTSGKSRAGRDGGDHQSISSLGSSIGSAVSSYSARNATANELMNQASILRAQRPSCRGRPRRTWH